MIAYFPEIYPDELVYSWFCRYYVHSGCFTHSIALKELFQKRCNNPSKEFIGYLNQNAKNKIEEIYSMNELILKHTMFSQYAKFLPLAKKKEALHHLKYNFCDPHYLFSILPRSDGEQYLKYCPICAKEDRLKYGETYWHRKHQIRNIRICTKHKCTLNNSKVIAKDEQTYTFCPAENYVVDNDPVTIEDSTEIQFTKYLEKAFNAPVDLKNDIPISAILYYGMKKTKYLRKSGKTRNTKMLADDIKEYYGKIKLDNIATINQIQRVLLGNNFDFSTICQIAFYIEMDINELVSSALTKEQIEHEQNTHYMKNVTPINWQKYDNEIAPLLEQFAKKVYNGTMNKIGRPERISEKMIYRNFGLRKDNFKNLPKCKTIIEKYEESCEENYARRIVWAYQKLIDENKEKQIYWSDIRELSGVKKKNLEFAIPHLKKYAKNDIVTSILKLI